MIPFNSNPLSISKYTKLQYLEKTENQYIDTGYIFDAVNKHSQVELKLFLPSGITTSNISFGVREDNDAKNSLYLISYNLIIGDSENFNAYSSSFLSNQINTFKFANGKYSVNNEPEINTNRFPNTKYPFGLFAFNTKGAFAYGLGAKSGTRIYYCKFYEFNILVHNFIPVLDFNNIPCMYDTITHTFKYNKGSGTFLYA